MLSFSQTFNTKNNLVIICPLLIKSTVLLDEITTGLQLKITDCSTHSQNSINTGK
jgi:hypothetical protein